MNAMHVNVLKNTSHEFFLNTESEIQFNKLKLTIYAVKLTSHNF